MTFTFIVTAWKTTILAKRSRDITTFLYVFDAKLRYTPPPPFFPPSFNVGMMHRQSVNSIYNIEPGGVGRGVVDLIH